MKNRIQMEDALKHLYKAGGQGQADVIVGLAGALALTQDQAGSLLGRLQAAGLITLQGDQPRLTEVGTESALKVIRAHRLYEKYLADTTGIPEARWHSLAEAEEHRMTTEQLAELEARLGYPRFDPHGDPIPSEAGIFPPQQTGPLVACPVGWRGRIAHVEDEPASVYDRIVDLGLAAGMRFHVMARDEHGFRLMVEGLEVALPLLLAGNIAVQDVAVWEKADSEVTRLSQLKMGEVAEVTGLTTACRGAERNRLLDLGVVPGTAIEIEFSSPSGNPVAYRIRTAAIALRRDQADKILITRKTARASGGTA